VLEHPVRTGATHRTGEHRAGWSASVCATSPLAQPLYAAAFAKIMSTNANIDAELTIHGPQVTEP
jgi:hypothetical protein